MTAALVLPLHRHRAGCSHHEYRLPCAQFDVLLWRSGGRCEVCRLRPDEVPQKRPLYVDHDGRLGHRHVRGLLCCKCNAQMRFVDSGARLPTPAQRRYLDEAWFWTSLPGARLDRARQFVPYSTAA